MKEMRKQLLKQFDEYVRNEIGDDEITCDIWLAEGVPDGATEQDYIDIAENDSWWVDVVNCFARCCSIAGVIE